MGAPEAPSPTSVHIRLSCEASDEYKSADGAELSIPTHCGRKALRSVLRSLLSLPDEPTSADFHFALFVGEKRVPVRTTLSKLLLRYSLSAEATLKLSYYEPINAPTRKPPTAPPHPTWLSTVDARSDGTLLTGSMNGLTTVRRLDGTTIAECSAHNAPVKAVAWGCTDDAVFITTGQDEAARVWRYTENEATTVAIFRTEDAGAAATLEAATSYADTGAISAFDGAIWLLPRLSTYELPSPTNGKRSIVDEAPLNALRLALPTSLCVPTLSFVEESRLLSGGWDSCVRVWDTVTSSQTLVLPAGGRPVTGLCAAPSGVVATCGADGAIRILDSRGDKGVVAACTKKGAHSSVANAVKWVQNDMVAVSCGADASIRVWDLRAIDVPVHILQHAENANALDVAVATSDNGRFIASVGSDGQVSTFAV